ncbi:MAG TPA: FKBP-type peptidyl-prolyl cis-trans isomerase [Chitinophagaceae bacterium]|nr:FKBP-type peptidyl-prolyl cis-trans isomerase [Chitinophagaceae bacterium]
MQSRILLFIILVTAVVAGCNKISYRKTPGGLPYKLFPADDTQRVRPGNIIKLNLLQKINDSVYYNSFDKLPLYFQIESGSQPYELSELWTRLEKGDSVIATQMMDTFIKRNPQGIPPHFKKGDRIVTQVRILDVFVNDSLAQLDRDRVQREWLEKEISFVGNYLSQRKINAQKTESGAFVEVLNPGVGEPIDSGNYVTINYTGKTFSGKVFDSNVDTSFQHAFPYSFVTGGGQMIRGFDEGVRALRKGAVARIYVPSLLGYGADPRSPNIKPFDHLIFDVTILDVKEKAPDSPPVQ